MKLIFSLLFICILFSYTFFTGFNSACAKTLKGAVSYTVEAARKEAFANVEYTIPQSIIDSNLVDPNFEENKKAIKNGSKELGDRYITHYSNGGYGIIYKNNLYYEFYYKDNGNLDSIGKRTGLTCPTKSYVFKTNGNLEEIHLYVSLQDTFIFKPNGELSAHWIYNKCYDKNGKLIMQSN